MPKPPVKRRVQLLFSYAKTKLVNVHHRYFSTRRALIRSSLYLLTVAILSVAVIGSVFPDLFHFGIGRPSSYVPIQELNGKPIVLADRSEITIDAEISDSIGVSDTSAFVVTAKNGVEAQTIQSNLAVDPPLEFTTEQINENQVRVIPGSVLGDNTVYSFSLDDAAVDSEEAVGIPLKWAFQTKDTFRVISAIPRNEANNVPVDTGIEFVFSHENYEDILPYVTITPSTNLTFERHKKTAVLIPEELQAGTIYTITLNKDLSAANSDETLGEDYTITFETAPKVESSTVSQNNELYFDFGRQFIEVPIDEKPAIGVYSYPSNNTEIN